MKVKTNLKAGGAGYWCSQDSDCPKGGKCEQVAMTQGMCAFS